MMQEYTQYIWILWDIAAIMVLALFVWGSAMRGFIRTFISLVGYVAALWAARAISPFLAEGLYERVVKDALRVLIVGRLDDLASGGHAGINDLIGSIPEGLQRIMDQDVQAIADTVTNSNTAQIVELFIDAALRKPVISALEGVLFLLAFTLTSLAVRYFSRFLTGFRRIPLIGTVDAVLGGVIGVGQGCLVLLVGALALQLTVLLSGGYFWLNETILNDTYILRVFYHFLKL